MLTLPPTGTAVPTDPPPFLEDGLQWIMHVVQEWGPTVTAVAPLAPIATGLLAVLAAALRLAAAVARRGSNLRQQRERPGRAVRDDAWRGNRRYRRAEPGRPVRRPFTRRLRGRSSTWGPSSAPHAGPHPPDSPSRR